MSIDTAQIERWLRDGHITADQATKLADDVRRTQASAGGAMLLASAALNGAVLFLFTRLYSVDVAVHGLLALWLVCVLPLAYATRARTISAACGLLFSAWVAAFAFRGLSTLSTWDRWSWLSPMLLLGGTCAFALGGLHYLVPGFENVARGSRIAGLQIAVLSLFTMTFDFVAEGASFFNELRDPMATTQVEATAVAVSVVIVIATILGQSFARARERNTQVELGVNLLLAATALVFVFVPISARTSAILACAVLVLLLVPLLVVGVRRRDARLMRIAGFSLSAFLSVRLGIALSSSQGVPVALLVALAIFAVGFFGTSLLITRRKRAAAAVPSRL